MSISINQLQDIAVKKLDSYSMQMFNEINTIQHKAWAVPMAINYLKLFLSASTLLATLLAKLWNGGQAVRMISPFKISSIVQAWSVSPAACAGVRTHIAGQRQLVLRLVF